MVGLADLEVAHTLIASVHTVVAAAAVEMKIEVVGYMTVDKEVAAAVASAEIETIVDLVGSDIVQLVVFVVVVEVALEVVVIVEGILDVAGIVVAADYNSSNTDSEPLR